MRTPILPGLTYSTNFPTTVGALQSTAGGAGDAFMAKGLKRSRAASLVYSTYSAAAGWTRAQESLLTAQETPMSPVSQNLRALGFTPAVLSISDPQGEGDAFVAKLTTTGALSYFTYLGGTNADAGHGNRCGLHWKCVRDGNNGLDRLSRRRRRAFSMPMAAAMPTLL